METITYDELKQKIDSERPNNSSETTGYALVNVLKREDFLNEHIPGSIHIPKGKEQEFEKRFDKSKEIILYCSSFECPAANTFAQELRARGFTNVIEYEGGMSDWKENGSELEAGEADSYESRMY